MIIMNKIYKARTDVVKAMAHEARMAIIDILGNDGEHCVCELEEKLGISQSSVSKHLSKLKDIGIVGRRKEGLKVYYSLKTPCIVNFFSCIDNVLQENIAELKEIYPEV